MNIRYVASTSVEDTDDLEHVVARIKTRGEGAVLPAPSPAGVAAFVAHAGHEQPMSAAELEEHERMWRVVDAEIEALDSTPAWGDDPA